MVRSLTDKKCKEPNRAEEYNSQKKKKKPLEGINRRLDNMEK